MSLKWIERELAAFEKSCEGFLSVQKMSDEEKEKLSMAPSLLHIRAFDTIVNECKQEIGQADEARMCEVLQLLFGIETDPLDFDLIAKALEEFVTIQLNADDVEITERDINDMKNIINDIDEMMHILVIEFKELKKKSQKWYVFNRGKQDKLRQILLRLQELKKAVEHQMEFDAKVLAQFIIDNFYNTYIFFAFLTRISLHQSKQLVLIEIANSIDRYIGVIEPIFNHRRLQSQDMLYHYVMFEFKELKKSIFETLGEVA